MAHADDSLPGLSIGMLARHAGTKVETIRYYERVGLLRRPARSNGNHRLYAEADAERLAFIRHARELGFPLPEIRELLALAGEPERPCAAVDAIARRQLAEVRRKMTRLRALESELSRVLADCASGRIADCRVIELLADHEHGHCLNPSHGPRSAVPD